MFALFLQFGNCKVKHKLRFFFLFSPLSLLSSARVFPFSKLGSSGLSDCVVGTLIEFL